MNILRSNQAVTNGGTQFQLKIRRPGLIYQDETRDDLAFGPLSRIDHAQMASGVTIRMHEHTNDEIFSYMYKGEMLHEDSSGLKESVSPSKNMLMGAGKSFFHEESTPNSPVEMLQIFIRPEEKDLEPQVQFAERTVEKNDTWNLLVGPAELSPPLKLRQQIAIYDVHANKGTALELPKIAGMTPWLYVMDGEISVHDYTLAKGDAITGDSNELTDISVSKDSTLVLFLVDLKAKMTYAGNFSGHKR